MDIKVADALWASSMLPAGTVERWRVADGAVVVCGAVIAEVRLEDALHEILAPTSGRLSIAVGANSIIEPGSLLGTLAPCERKPRWDVPL